MEGFKIIKTLKFVKMVRQVIFEIRTIDSFFDKTTLILMSDNDKKRSRK